MPSSSWSLSSLSVLALMRRSSADFAAGHEMARPHLAQLRARPAAALDRRRAARMEAAAGGRVHGAGPLARRGAEGAARLDRGIGDLPRGEQSVAVGVKRVVEELVGVGKLD